MSRRFRLLGAGVLAVAAVAAFGAQVASAAKLVGSAGAVSIHGQSSNHQLVLTDNSNLKMECNNATVAGSIPSGGTETPVVKPDFHGCTFAGFAASVYTEGCTYEFHIGALDLGSAPISTDVECGTGAIEIVTLTCEVDIPTQQGRTTLTSTNGASDVVLETSISKVTYEVTKDGIGCPLNGVGHRTEADYTGTTTLTSSSGSLKVQ